MTDGTEEPDGGPQDGRRGLRGWGAQALSALDLLEHQRVRVTVDVAPAEQPDEALRTWLGVYDGLAEEEVDEVEAIALDRSRFMGPPP
jgi:hypothetical protein